MTIKIPQSMIVLFDVRSNHDNSFMIQGPFGPYKVEILPDIEFTRVVKKGKTIMVKKIINEEREYAK
jgi:hypothetical protein